MSDLCVVAMGGNSLIDPALPPTVENQRVVTRRAVEPIVRLMARDVLMVITHGNGPQVGFMQLRSELAREKVHEVPLDCLVADTQGAIGYMLQQAMRQVMQVAGVRREVIALVTEVEVSPDDPAFANPTKPIGRFYSQEEAEALQEEKGWVMVEDSRRGWRRVVASPAPRRIVQMESIRKVIEAGLVAIACGGGGVPVTCRDDDGHHGVEAVIDKDRASALLALGLGADRFLITTGVKTVCRDFLTDSPVPLHDTTIEELEELHRQGQFPPGSMGPKVEAAITFLRGGGREVVICCPDDLEAAFDGHAGTRITI